MDTNEKTKFDDVISGMTYNYEKMRELVEKLYNQLNSLKLLIFLDQLIKI